MIIAILVAALAATVQAQGLSADEIVARHLEARGGSEKLKAIQTVVYRNGTYREGTFTGSGRAFMAMARPYVKIVGDPTDSSSTFREGYDAEERFSDYRTVDGVRFPYRYTETHIATGKELSSMPWGVIEINRPLPREWFSPPKYERTTLQQFLEQLYYERSDTSAIRWSYEAFRRGHGNIDTRAGIEAIGFQMLKMGDHTGAILLLSLNVRDYPESSSAAFGLGRAHATARNTSSARSALERAVELDPANKRAVDALTALGKPPAK